MKTYKYLLGLCMIVWLSLYIPSYSYFFGLKSADNTITNIQNIQEMYGVKPDIVSFIFEWLTTATAATMESLATKIGKDTVYHIALSPTVTPSAINKWSYDDVYKAFFSLIKKHDIQVIFRTMHEMNWWRYHRSGDPEEFKSSWSKIRQLSREVWLGQDNILFDFSVNHVDMPSIDNKPSQSATLISCTPNKKLTTWCYSFEDYWPGDDVVDVVWFSMYNRGKWWDDRLRLTPEQIIYNEKRDLLDRLSQYDKPIIIDEVWTTSAKYAWSYDRQKTINSYKYDYESKNQRLRQLKQLLEEEDRIKWAVYFNVDYTRWHTYELRWESDRAVFDIAMNKVYYDVYPLINESSLDKKELWFGSITSGTTDTKTIINNPQQELSPTKKKRMLKWHISTVNNTITQWTNPANSSGDLSDILVEKKISIKPIFD